MKEAIDQTKSLYILQLNKDYGQYIMTVWASTEEEAHEKAYNYANKKGWREEFPRTLIRTAQIIRPNGTQILCAAEHNGIAQHRNNPDCYWVGGFSE